MPELPEVETTKRGISPYIIGKRVKQINILFPTLRWPIEPSLPDILAKQTLHNIERRGKYLVLDFAVGTLLIHLGMSGSLRVLNTPGPRKKHDHFEIVFSDKHILRLHDPRRFGAVIWCENDWREHALIKHLGPEPLSDAFNGFYLHQQARNKTVAIKNFVMNSKIVVGVGNIYASESLFLAGINPKTITRKVSKQRCIKLADTIKQVLAHAIEQGGTTLKDFTNAEGEPGYFALQLNVYGREGEPCPVCQRPIKHCIIGQRATYYCSHCQR